MNVTMSNNKSTPEKVVKEVIFDKAGYLFAIHCPSYKEPFLLYRMKEMWKISKSDFVRAITKNEFDLRKHNGCNNGIAIDKVSY